MNALDGDATRAALTMPELIEALGRAFRQDVHVAARQIHEIDSPQGQRMLSLVMAAWSPDGYYGVKTVNIAPHNSGLGLPTLHGSYTLFDARSGVPLAQIDANELTARRTAAASALAASLILGSGDARSLLIVGAGRIGSLLPLAYRSVMSISDVRVWARNPTRAQALATHWRDLGMDAKACTDLELAVGQSDIVSCATLAREPLIRGRWLRAGSHLDLIGGFTPQMREADSDCLRDACVFIDTPEALTKSADLIEPIREHVLDPSTIRATLETLCREPGPWRTASQRSVFKSVGSALEDLAAATLAYERTVALPHLDFTRASDITSTH